MLSDLSESAVEILLDDRNVDLLEEGIDVALRMGALENSSMTARKLGESRRLVIGTPEYFERASIPGMPADLGAHQAVIYGSHGTEESWKFRQHDTCVAVTLSGRMSVSAAEGVRSAVLASLGLTIVSEWMFTSELKSGAVRAVLEE